MLKMQSVIFLRRISGILMVLMLSISSIMSGLAQETSANTQKKTIETSEYTAQYQRWGDFGSYHLGLRITKHSEDAPDTSWYINGSWDTTLAHDTWVVYQIPALFPVFLKAYIHPKHATSPIFNLREWEVFGPVSNISNSAAVKIITMAHTGMTKINGGTFMYSPVVRPFKLGETGFWTSNSYVASLVHWANEDVQSVPLPIGGTYPGINGPFLPKSVFE